MLDDAQQRKSLDPQGTLGILASLPEQLEEGLRLSRGLEVQAPDRGGLVVVGMGGSAIAGDLAGGVARRGGYALQVVRDVRLPPSSREDDLHVFISYSGNTWETLTCYREALRRGLPSLTISSGGELEETAAASGTPHLKVPSGLPPRGALGYLLAPLLALLEAPLPSLTDSLPQGIEFLARIRERWAPPVPTVENEAKALALALREKTPIVYATPSFRGVARRWRAELNEMAKVLAWSGIFPEMDHNELVGWMGDPEVGRFAPILLTVPENPRLDAQVAVTRAMMEERVPVQVVEPSDGAYLNQVLELVHLGDMVSVYLALARGVDPYPVASIDRLKEEVQKRRGEESAEGEI